MKSSGDITETVREEVKAQRQAKKLAKQAAKGKIKSNECRQLESNIDDVIPQNNTNRAHVQQIEIKVDKINLVARDETDKAAGSTPPLTSETKQTNIQQKKTTTKAERRAVQEAQRLAKSKTLAVKKETPTAKQSQNKTSEGNKVPDSPANNSQAVKDSRHVLQSKVKQYKVKLFNHLDDIPKECNLVVNNNLIHPSIICLGEQYSRRIIVGSNARCIAFIRAIKMIIHDYVTPPKKEFARELEATIKLSVDHLEKCRPLAVSIINAYKYIKFILNQLPRDLKELKLKESLCELLDSYVRDQINKAAEAISGFVQEKISDGDIILIFGCSSLINNILEEAHRRNVNFRVIVVGSRPFLEGQEMLRRIILQGISCTSVMINAIGFIMPEVTKVLLGAHALLANGYVMARTGTAQVALVARSFNVPVLVCCETHKFSERVQTDAIVFNELGNPDDLIKHSSAKHPCIENWQSLSKLYPLNLIYDVTPPGLVTAVVTEVAILPCTSVPVILRIRPTEVLY